MSAPKTFSEQLPEFIQQVESYLDKVVEHGTDQELFIASYLQGHFAVEAGQSSVQALQTVSELNGLMEKSLNRAFANNELEVQDQQQVRALWKLFLAR